MFSQSEFKRRERVKVIGVEVLIVEILLRRAVVKKVVAINRNLEERL